MTRAAGAGRRTHSQWLTTTAVGAFLLSGTPVAAQTAEAEPAQIEEVVVTGSRIARRDFSSSSPIATVDTGMIEASGAVTVEQVLNELPQLQANNTSNVNAAGGSGTLTADLRGLGSSRTLVLVNGRRFAPADTSGVVDLSSIPQALIDRVEVVTGGASAVYGSDAISGVVNFMLKNNFEGVALNYGFGQTTRGDGDAHNAELTIGANLAEGRGNAVLYGSYTKQQPVFQSQRGFSETALFEDGGRLVPGGSSRVPGTVVFGNNLAYPAGKPQAACANPIGTQFREGGRPTPFCLPEDGYNFAAPNYLQRPRERWQLTSMAHYDVTDTITVFAEAFYMNTVNNLQQAPGAVDFELVPNSRTLPVPLNNPLLPAQVRDFLAANFDADGDGVATLVGARRRFGEIGPRRQMYDRDTFQAVAGARGKLGRFGWEAFYQYGRTSTDEQLVNQVSNLRVAQGLEVVVGADGRARCANQAFGCVPINIFGFDSLDPQSAGFLSPTAFTKTVTERQVAGASISGDLFELPAGAVGAALGVEYRKESASFRPDATVQSGELGIGVDAKPLDGSFDLKEIFAEVRAPILKDVPFAHYLGVEGAVRYSDYSTVGGVLTYKAGGEWAPFEDLRFRGLYQRAVRAPNLIELFQGQSTGVTAYRDPCDVDRNPDAGTRQFCISQGVPAGSIGNFQQDDVVVALSGGNPDLTEERSDTWTLGAVLQPSAFPGLSASLDYYSIKVDDAIESVTPQTIINQCFAVQVLTDPSCGRIRRLSNGRISLVESFNANIATFRVNGLDAAVSYRMSLPDQFGLFGEPANLTVRTLASWQFKREKQSDPTAPVIDCAGRYGGGVCSGQGIPIVLGFKALGSLAYEAGPLTVGLQGRYLEAVKPLDADSVVGKVKARFYTDLSASYAFTKTFKLSATIDNLFDTKPPLLGFDNGGDTNTDPAVYDVLGRRFFLRASLTF